MVIPHCPSIDLAVSNSEITLQLYAAAHVSPLWGPIQKLSLCHSCVCVTQHCHLHQCFFCPLTCYLTSCAAPHTFPRENGARTLAALDPESGCWVSMCVGVSLSPLQSNNHVFDGFQWKEWAQYARLSSGPTVRAAALNLTLSMWGLLLVVDGEKMSGGLQALLDRGEALSMKVIWGANTS